MTEETVAQLMQLRGLTRMTGTIHEAQALQLKYWPIVAVPHAKRSEVTFETNAQGGARTVYVALELDPKKKAPSDLQKRLEVLDKNVQWLLGLDWKVIITAGEKTLYTGKRGVEPRPKPSKKKRNARRRR